MQRTHKICLGIVIMASLLGGAVWYWGASFVQASQFYWYSYEDLRLGPYLPEVDEAKIMLLGGLKDDHAPFLESGISYYKILGETTLHGKDAEAVAENWRYLPRNPRLSDSCHNPLYAIQFRQEGKLILQTTICWHCNNHSISTTENPWIDIEFGFDGSSRISQALLSTLKKYVPPQETRTK